MLCCAVSDAHVLQAVCLWCLLLQEFNLPQPLVVAAQAQPDPEFPTVVFPNPEEGEGTWQMAFDTGELTRTAGAGAGGWELLCHCTVR